VKIKCENCQETFIIDRESELNCQKCYNASDLIIAHCPFCDEDFYQRYKEISMEKTKERIKRLDKKIHDLEKEIVELKIFIEKEDIKDLVETDKEIYLLKKQLPIMVAFLKVLIKRKELS
jgi:hypothetical protein